MSAADWLRLLVAALEVVPPLRQALGMVVSGDPHPYAVRVRDILSEESESAKVAEELRR